MDLLYWQSMDLSSTDAILRIIRNECVLVITQAAIIQYLRSLLSGVQCDDR
jgi:hypothetical protein